MEKGENEGVGGDEKRGGGERRREGVVTIVGRAIEAVVGLILKKDSKNFFNFKRYQKIYSKNFSKNIYSKSFLYILLQ